VIFHGLLPILTASILAFAPCSSAQTPARVTVADVQLDRVVEKIDLTGTVTAERQASLSSRTSGLVAKVLVDAGDHVEEGQTLLELDPALAEVDLKRAVNAHREAESRLAEARRLSEEGRQLAETRALPMTEAEARKADVLIAEAAVAQTEADRLEAEEVLRRHRLPAPFAGVISHKEGEVGEWVETGDVVLELVEVDRLRLDVRAPQEWLHLIPQDATARVRLDGIPDAILDGQVRTKVRVPDPVSRTFLIRLDIEDPKGLMAPGMSASATFLVPTSDEALVIPRDALVRLPNGIAQVWLVIVENDQPVAQPRHVRLGRASGDLIEIREGLQPGDRVVVRGNETLRPGQPLILLESFDPPPS